MNYIEEIVLNWILNSSNEVYTYKTKCKIARYVKEYLNDALLITSYLYALDCDSKSIIISARGHNFLDDMNSLKMKASKFSSRYGSLLEEQFLSENVNRYKNIDDHKNGSYLENLLLKLLVSANIYTKDSKEYEMLNNAINKRPDDVFEALFICKLQEKNLIDLINDAVKKNHIDKEIDKLLVVARNFKILYQDKYKTLRNNFILGMEDNINQVHGDIEENFYKFEEEKVVDEWLYLHTEASKYDELVLAWWDKVSEFSKDREEYKRVVNYILNDSDTFLDVLMAMNVLGVNIEDTINMALMGEDFEFDELYTKYALASCNLKIYFKDAYKREDFIKSLSESLKRERRK